MAGQERCFFVVVGGGRSEGAAVCAGVFEARHVGRLAFGEAGVCSFGFLEECRGGIGYGWRLR